MSKKKKPQEPIEPDFDFDPYENLDSFGDFDASEYWLEPDMLLMHLVGSLVNVGGIPIGITLFIKGAVLTGELVGEREYLQAFTDLFTNQAKQTLVGVPEADVQEALSAFDFVKLAAETPPSPFGPNADGHKEPDRDEYYMPPRYLHLKDPVVIRTESALTFLESPIPIMRLRMSTIDGWMLGLAVPVESLDADDESSEDEILH